MKKILLLLFLSASHLLAFTNMNLVVTTNGNLVAPTNFFFLNSNAIRAVVSTNLIGLTVNKLTVTNLDVVTSLYSSNGIDARGTGIESLKAGTNANASGTYATAVGRNTTASANSALALGNNATASGSTSVAFPSATAAFENSIAMGISSQTTSSNQFHLATNITFVSKATNILGHITFTNDWRIIEHQATNLLITNVVTGGWMILGGNGNVSVGAVLEGAGPGRLRTSSTITSGAAFVAFYFSPIGWSSRSWLYSPNDGYIALVNNAESAFVRLIFGTNTVTSNLLVHPSLSVSGAGLKLTGQDGAYYPSNNLSLGGALYLNAITTTNLAAVADQGIVFASTNNVDAKAEVYVIDEDGNCTILSPHSMDGPSWLYDLEDDMPSVTKEIQFYLGKVRWHNKSREASLTQQLLQGVDLSVLPKEKKTFLVVETFDEYNIRVKFDSLTKLDWTIRQNLIQTNYALNYTNEITTLTASYNKALENGDTNATLNLPAWSPPPIKSLPAWLSARGAK